MGMTFQDTIDGGSLEECENNDCTGCAWCDALGITRAPLSAVNPWQEIARVLVEVDAVVPTARPLVDALLSSVPDAARIDGSHPYWNGADGVSVLTEIVLIVDTAFQARGAKP